MIAVAALPSVVASTLPFHLAFWQRTVIGMVVLLAVVPAVALGIGHGERVLRARARRAMGPSDVGPGGALQPLADLGKAAQTEDLLPVGASRAVAGTAVAVAVGATFGSLALVPIGPHQVIADPGVGVAVAIGLLMAAGLGFLAADGTHQARALLGRSALAAALLAATGAAAAVTAGSASVAGVVSGQIGHAVFGYGALGVPGVVLHPLGFAVWVAALTALWHAGPFRAAVAGVDPLARLAGLRRWVWCFVRWVGLLAGAALAATLFLGGWAFPWHPTSTTASVLGPVVLAAKTVVIVALIASTEVAWPPLGARGAAVVVMRWLVPMALIDLGVSLFATLVW